MTCQFYVQQVAEAIVKDALEAFEIQSLALIVQRHMPMVPLVNIMVGMSCFDQQLKHSPPCTILRML